jgi:small-conductance mechanosensitive channel
MNFLITQINLFVPELFAPYVLAIVFFVITLGILKFVQLVLLAKMKSFFKKTKNTIDDSIIDIVSYIRPSVYIIISLYVSVQVVTVPSWVDVTFDMLIILTIAQFAIHAMLKLLDVGVTSYIKKQEVELGEQQAEHTEAMVRIIRAILLVVLWLLVGLFILSNQGVNITSLIASLGIGGIAVALALQNVLSDLFASFSIFLDTPFKVGDYIQFGTQDGIVEKIGIRSTRIRTLHGEQLIVPNTQLVSAEIQNYRRMQRRREVMTIGTVYELSSKQIQAIPQMIREIVESVDKATFDRSHFSAFGDFALQFETVYFIDVPDYETYMDVKQEVHQKLFERFEVEGIHFAYPTQMVYVSR